MHSGFNEHQVIHDLKHFLPAQAPLMDFVHHNTLHAFQNLPFHEALEKANTQFGYQVYFPLETFREMYADGRISVQQLDRIIESRGNISKEKVLKENLKPNLLPRIGALRGQWKKQYKIDLDALVHPNLFRLIASYLDQGISIWSFPNHSNGFLNDLRDIESKSFVSLFKTKQAKELLLQNEIGIKDLLRELIGKDQSFYEQYLYDQQFAHQGWSGMVSSVEDLPQSLLDTRKISLEDLIHLELILEIDALNYFLGENQWKPIVDNLKEEIPILH